MSIDVLIAAVGAVATVIFLVLAFLLRRTAGPRALPDLSGSDYYRILGSRGLVSDPIQGQGLGLYRVGRQDVLAEALAYGEQRQTDREQIQEWLREQLRRLGLDWEGGDRTHILEALARFYQDLLLYDSATASSVFGPRFDATDPADFDESQEVLVDRETAQEFEAARQQEDDEVENTSGFPKATRMQSPFDQQRMTAIREPRGRSHRPGLTIFAEVGGIVSALVTVAGLVLTMLRLGP